MHDFHVRNCNDLDDDLQRTFWINFIISVPFPLTTFQATYVCFISQLVHLHIAWIFFVSSRTAYTLQQFLTHNFAVPH